MVRYHRNQLFCLLAGAALTVAGAAGVQAQSVDDLLQPGNNKSTTPGTLPGTTPGTTPGTRPTVRPQPTANDFIIAPTRPWTTAHAIRRVLQRMGYLPQIRYGRRTKNPYLRFKMERKLILLRFFGCTRHPIKRCKGILISTGYKLNRTVSLTVLNDWHFKRRYTYAYRVPKQPNVVWLGLDLSFSGGMTTTIFKRHLDYFRLREGWFRKHIGFSF